MWSLEGSCGVPDFIGPIHLHNGYSKLCTQGSNDSLSEHFVKYRVLYYGLENNSTGMGLLYGFLSFKKLKKKYL